MNPFNAISVRCPCCDQTMQIEPHQPGAYWSAGQVAAICKMRANGIPNKVIGTLFGVSDQAVQEVNRYPCRIRVRA